MASELSAKKIRTLVTGCSGFIGRQVCRELLSHGRVVWGVSRRPVDEHHADSAFTPRQVDLLDQSALSQAVDEFAPQQIIHLAAHIPIAHDAEEDDWRTFRANVRATVHLLEACSNLSPAPSVVYTSSMSVYAHLEAQYLPVDERHPVGPREAYGFSKYIAETLCDYYSRACSTAVQVLRLPGVYGPGRSRGLVYNLLASCIRCQPVEVTSGKTRRDFIYVKDAARAVRLAAEAAKNGYSGLCNVSGGPGVSAETLAEGIREVTGRSPAILMKAGKIERDFYFDPRSAEQLLNFSARKLTESLDDFWNYLRSVQFAEPA